VSAAVSWFTGVVVYVLVWWTALFVVLPFRARPRADADAETGWRGAPDRPFMRQRLLATTILSGVIWLAIYGAVESGWFSFRDGILALPQD
jgi:predicted secreted protein